MILTTHILVAGAVATPFLKTGNTSAVFIAALASHYLADTIPHWSYRMRSIDLGSKREERAFKKSYGQIAKDLLRVFLDILVGTALLYLLLRPELTPVELLPFLLIIIGAILPDGLQGVQLIYKKFPIPQIQKFHDLFHYDNGGVGDLPLSIHTLLSQLLFVVVSTLVLMGVF